MFTEFADQAFFDGHYAIRPAEGVLSSIVDFFWQTTYGPLEDVTVTTFPRLGSTILINIGSPFVFKHKEYSLPVVYGLCYERDSRIVTHHAMNTAIFGIQLKVNFRWFFRSASRKKVLGVDDLLSERFSKSIRELANFDDRVDASVSILTNYLDEKLLHKATTVERVQQKYIQRILDPYPAADWEEVACCSYKSIERYFTDCVSTTPKKALNLLRARSCLKAYMTDRNNFSCHDFGYWDHSHFYKDVKKILV